MTNPTRKRVVTLDDLNVLNQNAAYARQKGEEASAAAQLADTARQNLEALGDDTQAAGQQATQAAQAATLAKNTATAAALQASQAAGDAVTAAELAEGAAGSANQAAGAATTAAQRVTDAVLDLTDIKVDIAQSAALATAAAGITPRDTLAAITGPDGYYRAMDTGEVYQRTGGVNTPRPDLKAAAVPLTVQRVPSIAALRAWATATDGQRATVLGYYAPGDGGGGEYRWDASSAATNNDGTVVAATGVSGGRWVYQQEAKTLPAQVFGVLGGLLDESPRLNAALAAAKRVMLPAAATVVIGAALILPSGLRELDLQQATLRLTGPGYVAMRGSHQAIRGGTIEHDTSAGAAAQQLIVLDTAGVTNITVADIRAVNPSTTGTSGRGIGVHINAANITNVKVRGGHYEGLNFGVITNENATNGRNITISGVTFGRMYGDCVLLNHPSSHPGRWRNATITGCTFEVVSGGNDPSKGFGVNLAGVVGFTVTGNAFNHCRLEGIHVEDRSERGVISGNTFLALTDDLGSYSTQEYSSAIHVIQCKALTVTNNVIDCGGNYRYGIYIIDQAYGSGGATDLTDQLIVSGNQVTSAAQAGYYLHLPRSTSSLSVVGNSATACAVGYDIQARDAMADVRGNRALNCTTTGMLLLGGTMVLGANRIEGSPALITLDATAGNAVIHIRDWYARPQTTVAATYAGWVDLHPLGVYTRGRLTVAMRGVTGGDNSRMFDVNWDGTTLTASQLATAASGSFGGTALRAQGGVLQARAFVNVADGTAVTVAAAFAGETILSNALVYTAPAADRTGQTLSMSVKNGTAADQTTTATEAAPYAVTDTRIDVTLGSNQRVVLQGHVVLKSSGTGIMHAMLLRSSDGGATWAQLPATVGSNPRVKPAAAGSDVPVQLAWLDQPPSAAAYSYCIGVGNANGGTDTLTVSGNRRALTAQVVQL